jgi:hypothetical protein
VSADTMNGPLVREILTARDRRIYKIPPRAPMVDPNGALAAHADSRKAAAPSQDSAAVSADTMNGPRGPRWAAEDD